jgi:hypothetical protein
MFEQPAKRDIDSALSLLMHEARRRTLDEKNRITSDAINAGALTGNRLIVAVADEADKAHKASIDTAKTILIDFVERLQVPATEITRWARPHLENLSNSVIGVIPSNGFPNDHKHAVIQYSAIFQQRVDRALREVEIGYIRGVGFARIEETGRTGRSALETSLTSREQRSVKTSKAKHSAVILTALHVETRAVLRHLSDVREEIVRRTVFYVGQFGDWIVSVAECGEGNASAAAIVERGIARFTPEVLPCSWVLPAALRMSSLVMLWCQVESTAMNVVKIQRKVSRRGQPHLLRITGLTSAHEQLSIRTIGESV